LKDKLTTHSVRAILDANRNALMLLELKFSICTLGLGAGTFIAALYGMNLKNFIEESDLGFWGVSGVCGVLSVLVLMYGMRRLRRVQKVSMWGDSPSHLTKSRQDEVRGLWGLGRGTAMAGLPPVGDPVTVKAERARKIAERMEQHRAAHMAQQLARKRRIETKKGGNGAAPASDFGGPSNGLGTT
jgi:magnesium transporter